MGRQIKVDLERTIPAPPARVHAALADYRARERILPASYLDYRVEEGGEGAGTVVSFRLRAGRRERRYVLEVAEPTPGVTLVERDRESSLITTWILSPTASGTATDLRLSTIWEGHGGIGGFFERTFAPRGLRRIHGELLDRLTRRVGAEPTS
ncbi:MAG TPA: SRPBCC family protein [Actinomycetes bacterium]|nr:SRPBCC family protein [Actinomycetes bacterium]